MKRLLIVIPLALLAIAALYWSQSSSGNYRISGIIEVDEIRVGSRIGGRVAQVHILEGQRVTAGQALVELEPFDLNERIAEANSALAARRSALARLQAGFREEEKLQAAARRDRAAATLARLEAGARPLEIQILRDRLAVAQADVDHAQAEYERVKRLFEGAVGATQEMDDATRGLAAARARFAAADDELKLAVEGTRPEEVAEARAALADAEAAVQMMQAGARKEDIAEARSLVESGESAVAALQQQRTELTVRSPGECAVEATDLQPGDLIPANSPVLTLVDPARLFIRAYIPENRAVNVGDRVSVRIDAYPNRRFAGEVLFVSRRGEFTPNNAQTPEERSKQVFRIKVLLQEGHDALRAGMSADVFLDQAK
ncbi:MAG: efflux RND transporter periplasmic adaptor subunit [Phycisphaerales bacterium]|nr:efflux RND transporter periplasmic adaptor subunit [Phycisphaerales bacterium]